MRAFLNFSMLQAGRPIGQSAPYGKPSGRAGGHSVGVDKNSSEVAAQAWFPKEAEIWNQPTWSRVSTQFALSHSRSHTRALALALSRSRTRDLALALSAVCSPSLSGRRDSKFTSKYGGKARDGERDRLPGRVQQGMCHGCFSFAGVRSRAEPSPSNQMDGAALTIRGQGLPALLAPEQSKEID